MKNKISGPFFAPPKDGGNGRGTGNTPATSAATAAVTAEGTDTAMQTAGITVETDKPGTVTADTDKPADNPAPPVDLMATRFDLIFDRPIFTLASAAKVNKGENNRPDSRKLASVVLPFKHEAPGYVPGTIYLKQLGEKGKPYIEFTFFGSMLNTAVKALDKGAAKAELATFRKKIGAAFHAWASTQKKEDFAAAPMADAGVDAGDDLGFSL